MVTTSEPRGTLEVALAHARTLLARDPMMAMEQAREILRVAPGHPRGLLLLGQALGATGRRADAIRVLREAAARDPESADAWRTLGDQLMLIGDGAGADAAYAHHIRASVNDPELRRAAIALAENDLPVAERILKPWLAEHPTDVAAIRMLAELAGRIGRNADAEKLLRRAIELSPSFAPARYNLATVLHRQNRPLDALAELDRLLADEPDNAAYGNLKGAVLSRIGDHGEAIGQFEAVLRQRPDTAVVWMSYGHALKTVGRREDSVAAYRRSIDLRAGLGEAWWSLANLKTVRFTAGDIARMEAALEGEIGTEDRFHLHFALGKAFEDAAAWEASFRHYAEGNRLRRQVIDHDAGETGDLVARSAALFTPAFFAARAGQGADASDPIFVLGMPRSGSTLVEQILASHPLVEGTRELPDLLALAHRLSGRKARSDPSRYPEVLAELDAAQLRALGEEYLEGVRVHRKTDRPYFIDKMPNNWAHIGLIHLILPNAKIVDTRRHPLGCCFSNFKQHFARGQAFSYSLEEMGRYYADYVAAMARIDAVLPGRVHRVPHEAMVADTEAEIRALLDHLGLPFDPACLRFWETERAVQTASSEQVRRPIFREGVEQWRHFEPWLGPLKLALDGLDRHYPALSG
ncbi:tetratricopeptide repeat-containing sulfotransferase family protein [Sphingomonas oligoaromativorans]|uniref:tetratricopeptide repeat-containing sulfotransferase family protein n=1 Tax=Sphingomonas oligoaromativorans TaxID=575322 RepID=UPI00141FBE9F|nr:tetratricopeptide repeat-containing sulfotransferase family protein [Sphingomonas oligoaromativorans]